MRFLGRKNMPKGVNKKTGRSVHFKDLTGQKFGRLIILKFDSIKNGKGSYWLCKCDCGNEKVILGSNLKRGLIVSCGCFLKERQKMNGMHFMSRKNRVERFYRIWQSMKERCFSLKCEQFKNYGGRGITICDRWLGKEGFINFKKDVHNSYLEHCEKFGITETTNDRINVNGNYEPSNCRWATKKEQANNKTNNKRK